jgi:hypothetical protein
MRIAREPCMEQGLGATFGIGQDRMAALAFDGRRRSLARNVMSSP